MMTRTAQAVRLMSGRAQSDPRATPPMTVRAWAAAPAARSFRVKFDGFVA